MAKAVGISADLPKPVRVREMRVSPGDALPDDVISSPVPLVLRGYVQEWPVVEISQQSPSDLFSYLGKFDQGAQVPVSAGPPSLGGRIFYNREFTDSNVERGRAPVMEVLERIQTFATHDEPPLIYLASVAVDQCLPGFRAENDVPSMGGDPLVSIWAGTRTRIAAHNDLPLNLACIAAGERTFTLFPPDQTANLYPGPFEVTPAGRPISMVDFHAPDLERFPHFVHAMEKAQIAELSAGDALFIPSMWWHHVEAPSGFNILINYWWRTVPDYFGSPQDALTHAMLTIRDMPPAEKEIWRDIFDHYVFSSSDALTDHIPEHARGKLGPMNDENARRTRAFLLNRLNR